MKQPSVKNGLKHTVTTARLVLLIYALKKTVMLTNVY